MLVGCGAKEFRALPPRVEECILERPCASSLVGEAGLLGRRMLLLACPRWPAFWESAQPAIEGFQGSPPWARWSGPRAERGENRRDA
jgi:hypothetical protein